MTEFRDTADGQRQWLGRDGHWYSSEILAATSGGPPAKAPVMHQAPKPPPKKRSPRAVGCLTFIVIVIVVIVVVAVSGGGPKANITAKATDVVALDGNTVRLYLEFTNHGKASGTANCVINTTVYNQFGDQVNLRVNSTGSNNSIPGGQTVRQYQDIGVDNGDAQYVKVGDVKIVDC